MKNTFFITGTDTSVGKTYISTLLLRHFNKKGYKTFGIKPIATGCQNNNNDALDLQAASSIYQDYSVVNPIALTAPVAPQIAAKNMGLTLTAKSLSQAILSSIQPQADINLVEGVGGWLVPLNDHELVADAISLLNMPVILVVGIKLGCLNHALLTSKSIIEMKVPFMGWIANCIAPDTLMIQQNIDALKEWIATPFLGSIPYG